MDSLTTNPRSNKLKEIGRYNPVDVREFLEKCDLSEYYESFIAEGFESLGSVYEITEDDMLSMGVKRGHRRVIQREIATAKGVPRDQPLAFATRRKSDMIMQPMLGGNSSSGGSSSGSGSSSSGRNSSRSNANSNSSTSGYGSMSSSTLVSGTPDMDMCKDRSSNDEDEDEDDEDNDDDQNQSTLPSRTKRRYRRHPKSDPNAPVKPPSAYITFSSHIRAQLKDENMNFADQAKLIGERWSNLNQEEKQQYEREAIKAKDEYLATLDEYHQTPGYKEYQDYLVDFRNKQGNSNRKVKARKRAKRQSAISSRSSGTNGSSGSGSMDGYYGDHSSSLNSRRDSSNDTSRSGSSPSSADQAMSQPIGPMPVDFQKRSPESAMNMFSPVNGPGSADRMALDDPDAKQMAIDEDDQGNSS